MLSARRGRLLANRHHTLVAQRQGEYMGSRMRNMCRTHAHAALLALCVTQGPPIQMPSNNVGRIIKFIICMHSNKKITANKRMHFIRDTHRHDDVY